MIVAEKASGAKPGFTARDANGVTWFVQFDDRDRREASTGAVEVATKIFWALGYNQVETFLTTLDPARVDFDPAATVRRPSGVRTPFTRKDLDAVLERAEGGSDGTYRVVAGRRLEGEVLGGFRYSGTRPDDPNDIVPHEHRRELRALRVFGAWTNLTDLKAGNTLDTLVKENGRSVVKHYLQDVGSTFGTANGVHDWDIGWEHFYEGSTTMRRFFSLGFALSPWQTVPYTEYESIGRFEGDRFDPRTWKPQTPTPAYVEMRADDAFWAARRVMAFSDDLIRAAVHAGEYSDPVAEAHLVAVLIKRRDAIGRAYLPAITPIVDPRLEGGMLAFDNAAVTRRFRRGSRLSTALSGHASTTRPARRSESPRRRVRRRRCPHLATCPLRQAASSRLTSPPKAQPTRRGASQFAFTSVERPVGGRSWGWNVCRISRTLPLLQVSQKTTSRQKVYGSELAERVIVRACGN